VIILCVDVVGIALGIYLCFHSIVCDLIYA